MGKRTEAELRLELANLKMVVDKQKNQLETIDRICDKAGIIARTDEAPGLPSAKIVTQVRVEMLANKLAK